MYAIRSYYAVVQPKGVGSWIPAGGEFAYQMHDVLGQIVLARRDEDLGAGDPVRAIGLRLGAGAQQPQEQ